MKLFSQNNPRAYKVFMYTFWKYQYSKRREDNILLSPAYDPTPLELCDDIINDVDIPLDKTGFDKLFFNFGFNCLPEFCDDGYISVKFNHLYNEDLLSAEIHALLQLLNGTNEEELAKAYYDMAFLNIKLKHGLSFSTSSWAPRAIGLWLWDYCQNNGGVNTKGVKAKSLSSLETEFGEKRLAMLGCSAHSKETRPTRKFIERTDKCIKTCEVLTFR